MIPKKIGRYRIKAELGRGGMSTVYLAHDPHFERDVAVKLLPLELLHQPTFRRRFEREAKVVAALDHPAIVPVYDFGEEGGQPFLVMRSMSGGSLSDRLKQGSLTIKEASAIISRLAPALDEVHAHSVIHRDIKPSNILFDQRNDPYISDFGTAKLMQAQTKLTDTGGAVGTPAYMSPEQIQGDEEIDGRSDIYSLGVILFEMLTGQHPYQTNTPIAVAVKHIFEPVPPILEMVPNLPTECQEIIGRAMAKDKTDRFVTAQGFATTLADVASMIETSTLQILSAGESAKSSRRYALIINNNEFQDPMLSSLVKPSANVAELAEVLQSPLIGSFDEVITLNNEPAHNIRREISKFFANKKSSDLLLLYYTGHAAIGSRSRLYLAANNTEHKLLRGTAIPAGFISDEMDNCVSKHQILILDCHFSNAIDSDLPSLVGQTVNTGATFARNGHERIVITATDSTQYNWHNNEVKGKAAPSQFTRHLINGLRSGAADIDQDGKITVDELFAYIYDRVARNSVDEHIQMPRKWTPFSQSEGAKLVLAVSQSAAHRNGVDHQIHSNPHRAKKHYSLAFAKKVMSNQSVRWVVMGIFVIVFGLLFAISGSRASSDTKTITPEFSNALHSDDLTSETQINEGLPGTVMPTETAELSELLPLEESAAIPTATLTPTRIPSATTTAVPTTTPTHTAVSATITPTETILVTTAVLSSSLYNAPDSDAQELTFVGVGEQVIILGRSQYGEWLYVQTDKLITGFVYGPRFDWDGEYETLEIVIADSPALQSTTAASCAAGACPTLTMDIYPLAAYCQDDTHFRTVFIQGHGGSGSYTYYWNDSRLTGTIANKGFAFDVSSPDGSPVIGWGKVVSSDGQTIEKELFVNDFSCN